MQVRYAQQEVELTRVKRRIIHDKQLELPIREIKDSSLYHRVEMPPLSSRELEEQMSFNDPFFNDMWYLVSRIIFPKYLIISYRRDVLITGSVQGVTKPLSFSADSGLHISFSGF